MIIVLTARDYNFNILLIIKKQSYFHQKNKKSPLAERFLMGFREKSSGFYSFPKLRSALLYFMIDASLIQIDTFPATNAHLTVDDNGMNIAAFGGINQMA